MEYDAAMRFARAVAEHYDDQHSPPSSETLETVRFIKRRAAQSAGIVEFGVGTGRIALPLAGQGYDVWGVDSSPEMLAELRKKDPSGSVTVHQADMSSVQLGRRFGLAVCVFNSLHALASQDRQVAFFENAARHLDDGGHLVVETEIIGLREFAWNKRIAPVSAAEDRAALALMFHDPLGQRLTRQNIEFSSTDIRLTLNEIRYTWPAELDLMARLAGLTLAERFGGWEGAPFAGEGYCISVYRR
jgi:SAM-dependent methyltransferase